MKYSLLLFFCFKWLFGYIHELNCRKSLNVCIIIYFIEIVFICHRVHFNIKYILRGIQVKFI